MKQQLFEQQREKIWRDIEQALDEPKSRDNNTLYANHYMRLCQHLALSKQRMYDTVLTQRLNSLVMRLYRELYRYKSGSRLNVYAFFVRDFPLAIYSHRYFIAVALAVFILPAAISGIWVYTDENAIYSVLDSHNVRQMESMYDPDARKLGREREADTDIMMFGYYIQNNISIAFRCFAGGLLLGLGSLLVLFFNGLQIGSVAGHLTRLDFIDTFYPFVVGHSAFELTAIVFSGAAGLKLGYSLLDPGHLTRPAALQLAGRNSVSMLYGIVLMLLIAAFIEAFWSSSTAIPIVVKYAVGAFFWFLVLLYCLSGKRFEPR
jgi:uncharacterized membrane protein SpoIIM required for sporulation